MKKNYNYNELVRFYNRSLKKLRSFIALGKNPYKQDILKRRVERLFNLLSEMQTKLRWRTATAAAVTAFAMIQPDAAKAQNNFLTPVTNPFGLTNAGDTWTNPTFADLDNDGDMDMMTGKAGGDFVYFENTGTASAPMFGTLQSNPFGLSGSIGYYSTTAFVDLDNDGDWDLISGEAYGNFYYFENTGTAAAPAFGPSQMNPFGLTAIGSYYSIGSFTDLDGDGDLDFVSGEQYGNFLYYENTGTVSAPAFAAPQNNPYGLVALGLGVKYSTTTFYDLDNDGDKDLMSGANNGNIYYFENLGTATGPYLVGPAPNQFGLTATSVGGSTPWFVDLDNDGDMDIMAGNSDGDFEYYENTMPLRVAEAVLVNGVGVFPNPTSGNVTLKVKTTGTYMVEVTNTLGQLVSKMEVSTQSTTLELPQEKGIYFVKVSDTNGNNNVIKVVKN